MTLYKMVLKKLKTVRFLNSLQALREERGAIFVLTAILLPVLLGGMGFAYDVGNLYMHKARLQNAADAASLAGARAFVDEAATQRKTLRTQYMNNNNVTTIPSDKSAEINETVKAEAKTAAKTAAVANVGKNMVNLHNNNYQSEYFLITGRITESGKNYEQQYFKANLKETVPLFFIPVLLDLKEQEVAAEAISTIINKATGKSGDSNKKEKFGPDSLFMTKHGFANLGDTFYNDGAGNTNNPPKAPTWTDDYFEGNLRYTEDDFIADFGNNTKVNNYAGGVPFDRVFNKKATELMTKLKRLMGSYNKTYYDEFIEELKTHPDFYSSNDKSFTAKGNALFLKTKDLLPESGIQYDIAFWGVYNAFYDELASNKNYYRTFEKLNNYDIDKFGVAVKALFKRKLAAEQGISEETYRAQYQAAHDAWVATTSDGGQWKTEHDTWQTNHNNWKAAETAAIAAAQAQIDEMAANGGGESSVVDPYNATPQQAYEILKKYKDMYSAKSAIINGRSGNDYIWDIYNDVGDNRYFAITQNEFPNYVYNISYNSAYNNWEDVTSSDWLYWKLRQDYESYKANGGTDTLSPKDAYDKLALYKDFVNQNADTLCTILVMNEYKKDGSPYGVINAAWEFDSLVKNMPATNTSSLTWEMINYNNSDFQQLNLGNDANWWVNLKQLYTQGNGNLNPSSSNIPTLSQLMASWYADPANAEPEEPQKPAEPQLEDYIPSSNGDEYYAQYHGSEQNWTASAISSQQNSKEHSYFYYPAPINFTLTIDEAGFYTDDKVSVEDPFYLFIGDNFQGDVINIELEADVNRPLIFCYMGTKNVKIHIELKGHNFQGIIYTPNAHGSEVFMNTNSGGARGTFKGTWMSDTVTLKQNSSHYQYEEYYLDSSLKKAMPNFTGEVQESGDEYEDDEDLSDKNPIKVIKLVKYVADILEVEKIE